MRTALRASALAALLFTCGCSSNNTGKIEGTKWSSEAATVKGAALPGGALSLEFSKDGKLTYRAGPVTFSGTYSLGGGNRVTFNLDQVLAGSKTHVEDIAITGDRLIMTDGDGTTLPFRKAG